MADKIFVSQQRLAYYDTKLKAWVVAKDAQVLADAKAYAKEYADGLAGNYEAAGSVATAQEALEALIAAEEQRATGVEGGLAERIGVVEGDLGTVENLNTTAKNDLVSAINEVRASVQAGGTAAAITISTETTTDGMLKSYSLFQGENKVGTIDIPKDMVVESGEVVVNPEGQPEGTYIKLVLANVEAPLFINVASLVDIYKAKANATQIQITVDANTREISAAIVAGSVGTAELADNAVVTAKIADGNVTKAKLSTAVQASLDKADAAAPQTALDAEIERATGAEAKALADAKEFATGLNTAMNTRVEALEAIDHDHANKAELDKFVEGDKAKLDTTASKAHEHANAEELAKIASGDVAKWNAAEQNAKDFASGLVEGIALGDIATNKAAIEALQGTHATDKAAVEARVKAIEDDYLKAADKTELTNAIGTAEQNAKDFASGLVAGVDLSGIAANAAAIEALQGTHATDKAALEKAISDLDASFVEITEAQIDAMFA